MNTSQQTQPPSPSTQTPDEQKSTPFYTVEVGKICPLICRQCIKNKCMEYVRAKRPDIIPAPVSPIPGRWPSWLFPPTIPRGSNMIVTYHRARCRFFGHAIQSVDEYERRYNIQGKRHDTVIEGE